MAKKKASLLTKPFQGKGRIAEMDLWDNETSDLMGPAFIEFKGQQGEIRFRDTLYRRHRLARHRDRRTFGRAFLFPHG